MAHQIPQALVFVTGNVAGTYETLKAKGVDFAQPPKKERWGESAMFHDSEGNLILFGASERALVNPSRGGLGHERR
ncbi:MAG TPA: VOC family protein [Candidatus Eisenbacteria bacterium]|jgi:uncharacterized glyoxalase superfamily protein PhnB|nr:VOC family protein [Candidatus Eisenbacteria bacterium]